MPGIGRHNLKAAAPFGLNIMALLVAAMVLVGSHYAGSGRAAVLPGDVNGDGQVNVTDLSLLLSHWSTTYAPADLNSDNKVNIFDLSLLLSHWGDSAPSPSVTLSPLPPVSPSPSPTGPPLATTKNIVWQGYTWEVRDNAWNTGAPQYNGNWSLSNIVRGATTDAPLIMKISNPTGKSPYGAQLSSLNTFGYGTYTLNASGDFYNMDPSIVFGSIFTFDAATPGNPGYNEIDAGEVSRWGNINNAYPAQMVKQTYYTNTNKQIAMAGNGFLWPPTLTNATFQFTWRPGSLVLTIYKGNSTAAADILVRNTSTESVPVPAKEKLYINAWVYQYSNTGAPASSANVPNTSFTLHSFTFAP